MGSKVGIGEGTVFKIVGIVWLICFMIGGIFVFPFGFVFMGIFGLFLGIFVAMVYVNVMSYLFGERSSIDGERSKFNFFRGRMKREDD